MTIKRNLSDLPAAQRDAGSPPNAEMKFINKLVEEWYRQLIERGHSIPLDVTHPVDLDLAIPEAGPYRASYASKRCDRSLMYALAGVDATNPPSIADQWRFAIGHFVHDLVQSVAPDAIDGATIEVDVDLNVIGIPGSAHTDILVTRDGLPLVTIELKSVGGFKFKVQATTFKGPPEGPAFGAALQSAMSAMALGASHFVVGSLAVENLSASMAKDFAGDEIRRFAAEWRFKTDDWVPLVNHEAIRVGEILAQIDEGILTPRHLDDPEYPAGAVVDEPERKGRWTATDEDGIVVGTGTYWGCDGYCPHFDQCVKDGPS